MSLLNIELLLRASVSSFLFIIFFPSPKNLVSLSQLFILFLFDYVDTVYIPGLSKRLLHRIQYIQNSCLRFIYYSSRKFNHITPLFKQPDWLNIQQRFIFHACCLVFNVFRSNTLLYLRNLLPTSTPNFTPPVYPLPVSTRGTFSPSQFHLTDP